MRSPNPCDTCGIEIANSLEALAYMAARLAQSFREQEHPNVLVRFMEEICLEMDTNPHLQLWFNSKMEQKNEHLRTCAFCAKKSNEANRYFEDRASAIPTPDEKEIH